MIEMPLIRLAEVADIESGAGFPLHHQGKGEEEQPFDALLNAFEELLARSPHFASHGDETRRNVTSWRV